MLYQMLNHMEDEVSTNEEQTDDEEVAKLQGMWDFILPNEET